MHITLAAIGKMKPGPEQELCARYQQRCGWPVTLCELTPKKNFSTPDQQKEAEGTLLLDATKEADLRIALDEQGKSLSTMEFTSLLLHSRDAGDSHVAFLIGGADGLSEEVRLACRTHIAFGALTWPHMLARAMLCEQLYRAWSLHMGHPYHRE